MFLKERFLTMIYLTSCFTAHIFWSNSSRFTFFLRQQRPIFVKNYIARTTFYCVNRLGSFEREITFEVHPKDGKGCELYKQLHTELKCN